MKGAKGMPELNVKLTLKFERQDGKTEEKVIEGPCIQIFYILHDAGILDERLKEFLAH